MENKIHYIILTPDRIAINGWGYECEAAFLQDHCQAQFSRWRKMFNKQGCFINMVGESIELDDLASHCFYVELTDTKPGIYLYEENIKVMAPLSTFFDKGINSLVWSSYGVIALCQEKGEIDFERTSFNSPADMSMVQFLSDQPEIDRVLAQYQPH